MDRERTIERLEQLLAFFEEKDIKQFADNVRDAIVLLKEQEAKPIVRCNECRYSGLPYYDTVKCSKDGKVHYENWFCADGERR